MSNMHIIHKSGKVVGVLEENYNSEAAARVQINFPNSQITTNTVPFDDENPLGLHTVSITDNKASILTGSDLNAHLQVLEDEAKLEELRAERNLRLTEIDWWASSDLTMTDAQKKYRTDLRDITKSYKSIEDVVWPTKP